MTKKLVAAGFALSCVLLSGCASSVPTPTTYPYSTQLHMQVAHHWDLLAADVATKVDALLKSTDMTRAIIVERPPGLVTPFTEAFRQLLTSQLVLRGIAVDNDHCGLARNCVVGADDLRLSFATDVIPHAEIERRDTIEGPFTLISGAVAYLAADATAASETSLDQENNTEIIISTQVLDGRRTMLSTSNIFYINANEAFVYPSGPALETTAVKVVDR